MKKYLGQCHCKKVQFEFDAEIEKVFTCNCSHCSVKAFILTFISASQFQLVKGEDQLTEYQFNKKTLAHLFCKTCGVECFAKGNDPEGNKTVAINLRTVQDLNVSSITSEEFNGKEF